MKPVLIVKAGSAISGVPTEWGDFEHWIAATGCMPPCSWISYAVHEGAILPPSHSVAGVIITGSPAMVTDFHDWSVYTASWLAEAIATEIPILGICYGHQLLAHTLGGEVIYHPEGREIGTVEITQTAASRSDPLFSNMPDHYLVHVTHSQTVGRLPPQAQVLAGNWFEAHHAVRYREGVWGVQFHPEFSARIMDKYLELRSDQIKSEGLDVTALIAGVRETPFSAQVIRNFVAYCEASTR